MFAAALFAATAALAQSNDMEFVREPMSAKAAAPAPRIADRSGIAPAATLAAAAKAAPGEIADLRRWNDENRQPLKNGFTRAIDPIAVRIDGAAVAKGGEATAHARGVVSATNRGTLVWSGAVKVEGAYGFRLHLSNVKLPEGATLWVYGTDGTAPIAFGRELIDPNGDLYAPSVGGEIAYLEVEAPSKDAVSFDIKDLIEIVGPSSLTTAAAAKAAAEPGTNDAPTCLIDATCTSTGDFDVIAEARNAVAQLIYVSSGSTYVCSGGLLNDKDTSTSIPYFITANHCFDTQPEATSLEAYWDYKTTTCNGTFPNLFSRPRSNGATLLATSATNDFTFVRLNTTGIPAGRVLLGWDTAAIANGTKLHRISFPFPDDYSAPAPMRYSWTVMNTGFGQCSNRPQTNYLYSTGGAGGVYGGSSGSPVILAGGRVVGQLFGSCGPDPEAGCDQRNATVDGAFSKTYPLIKDWIDTGGNPVTPAACVPSDTLICLAGDRFSAKIDYVTSGGSGGAAKAIEYTPSSGLFWFFGPDNIEFLLKIIEGCPLNNKFWVYAAGTTDVGYTITVRDTKTGAQKVWSKPVGSPAPAITDSEAFNCP